MGLFDFTKPANGGRGKNAPTPVPVRTPMPTPDLESNYDLDYGYVALYDRDMKNYGKVLSDTAKTINREIRQTNANMDFRGIGFDASAMMAEYAQWQHNFVLEQENINPDDGIPAYAESMMYKGPDGSSVQYKAQGQDMKNEFYNTVYYCKDVLNEVTLRVLGDDYLTYAADRMQAESSANRSRAATAGQNTPVRRDYDAGISIPDANNDQYTY